MYEQTYLPTTNYSLTKRLILTHTATRLESVEEVVLGNGGGEALIKNHHHCLPNQLH